MKKINYNIVFIRFLAILIVMFGHSIIIYDSNWGLFTTTVNSNTLVFIKHIINIIQMPIWFAMAGYLYYFSLKKNKNILSVFKDKFKKLLLPFLIIGLMYLIPIRYLVSYFNYVDHSIIYNIIHNLILGFDNGHLWYLPTLFIIFLIFNFYKDNNKYIDIVIFILLIYLNIISNHFPTYLYYVNFYLLFFYLGILFNKYNLISNLKTYYSIIIILILIIYNLFINNSLILLLVQFISLILLFKIDFTKLGKLKIINCISNNSYGMYLFHSPLVYLTFKFLPNISPILMIVINFIVFGSISYIITYLIRKTKFKFIIGE